MLPRPYLRYFDGSPGEKLPKNWVLDLANRAETFVWECIESRIISDDRGKNIYKSILVKLETKIGDGNRNTTINMQNWG